MTDIEAAEVVEILQPVRVALPALSEPRRRECITRLIAMVEQVDEDEFGEAAFEFLMYVLCPNTNTIGHA